LTAWERLPEHLGFFGMNDRIVGKGAEKKPLLFSAHSLISPQNEDVFSELEELKKNIICNLASSDGL
jgi:hypothetical protein